MATAILSNVHATQGETQYEIPESERQKILSQTPLALLRQEIERQRIAFIRRHGDAFGAESKITE